MRRVSNHSLEVGMSEQIERSGPAYPIGRGYGHDYMRGGEVFGGYGYSAREAYERRRGELDAEYGGPERRAAGNQPPLGPDVEAPRS